MDKKISCVFAGLLLIASAAILLLQYPSTPAPPVDNVSSYYTVRVLDGGNISIDAIGLNPESFPALDGATSTQPVRSLIACEAFGGSCKNWYESEGREMFLYADMSPSGLSEKEKETLGLKYEKNSKTHDAYLGLIRGDADLILVSTLPSLDELLEAKEQGVILEATPIGLDGFIFLVNVENPVENLNTADIVDVYSGKVNNWKKYTGHDAPIRPFTRQTNSGSQELMEKLLMKGTPIKSSYKEELMIMSMSPLIEGIEQYNNSIGYSLYYYKNNMIDNREHRPDVKLISVDGVTPSPETIASKKYPHTFNIYAVTRTNETGSPAYQLKKWLTGTEGQEIIRKAGYAVLA